MVSIDPETTIYIIQDYDAVKCELFEFEACISAEAQDMNWRVADIENLPLNIAEYSEFLSNLWRKL